MNVVDRPTVEAMRGTGWSMEEMIESREPWLAFGDRQTLLSPLVELPSRPVPPMIPALFDVSDQQVTMRAPTMPQNTPCFSLLDQSRCNAINTYEVAMPAKFENK